MSNYRETTEQAIERLENKIGCLELRTLDEYTVCQFDLDRKSLDAAKRDLAMWKKMKARQDRQQQRNQKENEL